MSYRFETDCTNPDVGDAINEMRDAGEEITRRQFLRLVDRGVLREAEEALGYARDSRRGLTMASDWHVSYYRSTFQGRPCAYFCWSGIEHVYVEEAA